MNRILITLSVLLAASSTLTICTAEAMTEHQRKAILKIANDAKKAFVAKDHEAYVGFLYPEMIRALGGKERMIQSMKAEDAKNEAAGVVVESLDFDLGDTMHIGSEFRLTFITSTLVAKIGATKIQSKSFYVAFSSLQSQRWYLLDGTRLTMQRFRQIFRGFSDDLQLPKIEKRTH